MKPIVLTKETNEIQRVITLKSNRQKRHQYQEFVIEGHVALDEAIAQGWEIKAFFYDKDKNPSSWAKKHLQNCSCKNHYAISYELMEKISDKTDISELIAIAKMKVKPFSFYQPKAQDVLLVLDEPNSPGNLGMIIRSAAAFGASGIVLSGHAADEYDPKSIRASVGTFFSFPIYRIEGVKAFSQILESFPSSSYKVIGTGNKGTISIKQASFASDIVFLVLGNETSGLSKGYQALSQEFVQIPLPGRFTSLNIAAAASIFLYEIFEQRQCPLIS